MSKRIWVWIIVLMTFISANVTPQERESGPKRPTLKRRMEGDAQQNNLDQRVAELSEQISTEMTENRKRTIAVVEFVDLKGGVTDFGRYLSEELITRLFQTKKFTVIERHMLNKVIAEQKLTLTGTFDQSSARQLGRLLGVDAICSGTIGDLGQTLKVNARLISTETGAIFAVASTEILKDGSVLKLMGGAAPTASGKPGEASGGSNSRAGQTADSQFFTFELRECKASGTTVICELTVTNRDNDRHLSFSNLSTMIDNFGSSYNAVAARLANNSDPITGYGEAMLVTGLPTNGRIGFTEVSPQATSIAVLTLDWVVGNYRFKTQFRNVPLTR